MVQTLGTNSSNDIYIGADGNLVLLNSINAVVAACKTASLTQLGECVLQQGVGLPNFQTIWVGSPDFAIWQSYLENTLLAVEGVTAINSITLSTQNNVLNYVAEINTQYGITSVSS